MIGGEREKLNSKYREFPTIARRQAIFCFGQAKREIIAYAFRGISKTSQQKDRTMKILLWAILIIFLIGLLVVTGVFKMIF
ncbi:hypothetical protein C3369_05305 [Escherichia sp. ESNIH1]|nr:hypothetical protein C3369_05305 [Escherichia sp. ESNIH1]